MYVWGGIAESRWAGTPSYGKTTDLSNIAIHFFLARARKSPKLKTDAVFITLAAAEENI